MDDNLKDFCNNYEVKVVNDTQRYARYRRPTFFSYEHDASLIRNDLMDLQTEKLYTVQIPESRLKTLVEMEKRFMNHRDDPGIRDMFEEAHYRHTNESVKKAYEQYSIMLNLAGYQRKF
jgi:hypothetical protein